MVVKIKNHIRETGEWGEFFPISMSPFAYNETVANEYYPETKESAQILGADWREESGKTNMPNAARIATEEDLNQEISEISDDILDKIIICKNSNKSFKIIKQELDFYKSMKLPLPRLCPDERHKERMKLRNPRNLWHRHCQHCKSDIQTSYAPERPENVQCESCYEV